MENKEEEHIWFHYVDYMHNNEDYSVVGWDAAKLEAVKLIKNGIGFVCDNEIKFKIETLLEADGCDWVYAIELYNKHNAVKEFIAYRVGMRV